MITRELPRFVRDILSAGPPPRGGGLNLWIYKTARVLHPYRSFGEIGAILEHATASLPVKRGEIERAVINSKSAAWSPDAPPVEKRPEWPPLNQEQREAAFLCGGLADLWEASPVRLPSGKSYTEELIDRLFPGNPLLCVGQSVRSFATQRRDEWSERLSSAQFIVPSPMSARSGITKDGRTSAKSDDNTGLRRFLIIEQDTGTLDEQAGVLLHLRRIAPMVLAVHSGGKSIHGWFYCHGYSEEELRRFMNICVSLGADKALWTLSQFTRMPDGLRENRERQSAFYFNPSHLKQTKP
jgi:hypothetical protein